MQGTKVPEHRRGIPGKLCRFLGRRPPLPPGKRNQGSKRRHRKAEATRQPRPAQTDHPQPDARGRSTRMATRQQKPRGTGKRQQCGPNNVRNFCVDSWRTRRLVGNFWTNEGVLLFPTLCRWKKSCCNGHQPGKKKVLDDVLQKVRLCVTVVAAEQVIHEARQVHDDESDEEAEFEKNEA